MPLTSEIRMAISRGILLLAAVIVFTGIVGAQQTKKSSKKPPKASKLAAVTVPVAMPVPFRSGEILDYRVLFSKFAVNAAHIEAAVIEQRDFFGHAAWHFRASARTLDTTRLVFPLDDQFDSYSRASNLTSMQYELYLHEQGKQQTSLYRMTGDSDPAPPDVTALRTAPGTHDAVSFLYALRAADWQRNSEFRSPVFDGRRLYDAVARIDTPQGTVTVPAGTFDAYRIAIQLFDRGTELTDTRIWLWIAKDQTRTPVLIEADIPYGSSRIELLHTP
jgi:hypothetical protein